MSSPAEPSHESPLEDVHQKEKAENTELRQWAMPVCFCLLVLMLLVAIAIAYAQTYASTDSATGHKVFRDVAKGPVYHHMKGQRTTNRKTITINLNASVTENENVSTAEKSSRLTTLSSKRLTTTTTTKLRATQTPVAKHTLIKYTTAHLSAEATTIKTTSKFVTTTTMPKSSTHKLTNKTTTAHLSSATTTAKTTFKTPTTTTTSSKAITTPTIEIATTTKTISKTPTTTTSSSKVITTPTTKIETTTKTTNATTTITNPTDNTIVCNTPIPGYGLKWVTDKIPPKNAVTLEDNGKEHVVCQAQAKNKQGERELIAGKLEDGKCTVFFRNVLYRETVYKIMVQTKKVKLSWSHMLKPRKNAVIGGCMKDGKNLSKICRCDKFWGKFMDGVCWYWNGEEYDCQSYHILYVDPA